MKSRVISTIPGNLCFASWCQCNQQISCLLPVTSYESYDAMKIYDTWLGDESGYISVLRLLSVSDRKYSTFFLTQFFPTFSPFLCNFMHSVFNLITLYNFFDSIENLSFERIHLSKECFEYLIFLLQFKYPDAAISMRSIRFQKMRLNIGTPST